jgi:hypothetical protein
LTRKECEYIWDGHCNNGCTILTWKECNCHNFEKCRIRKSLLVHDWKLLRNEWRDVEIRRDNIEKKTAEIASKLLEDYGECV